MAQKFIEHHGLPKGASQMYVSRLILKLYKPFISKRYVQEYVYIYMYICLYIYMYMYMYVFIMYLYIYMCIYVFTLMFGSFSKYIYIHIYLHIYTCTYMAGLNRPMPREVTSGKMVKQSDLGRLDKERQIYHGRYTTADILR